MTDTTRDIPVEDEPTPSGAATGGALRERLSSLVRSSERVVDRIAGSVKDVARGSIVKQAIDAEERGNLPAAFWLLEEACRLEPDDVEVAALFWNVAVAYEHPQAAETAISLLIQTHANGETRELAAQYWAELIQRVPDALIEPATLHKLIRPLQQAFESEDEGDAKELRRYVLVKALRAIVDERNAGLSPGLAYHVAEAAREIDRDTALAAARVALSTESLHQAKRERLQQLLEPPDEAASSEPARTVETPPTPAQAATPAPPPVPDERSAAVAKHPLAEKKRSATRLSDDALERAKARLPRSTTAPAKGELSDDLEFDPNDVSHPEIEIDPNETSHPEIDANFPVRPPPSTAHAAESELPAEPKVPEEPEVAEEIEPSLEKRISKEANGTVAAAPAVDDDAVDVAPSEADADVEPVSGDVPTDLQVDVDRPRFSDIKSMSGRITALDEDRVAFEVAGGKTARVAYEMIQAVAIADVPDRPGFVIDLLLNWNDESGEPLRSVRLQARSFETAVLMADGSGAMQLGEALAEILARSHAIPLPDPDSVLGEVAPSFESIEAYEREVLQVAR